jgi:hypothetical protein
MAIGFGTDRAGYSDDAKWASDYCTPTTVLRGLDDATVRTDLSRDEHELIIAVREYNTVKDASDAADKALQDAREVADDARWEKDDAQEDFRRALKAVKHGTSYDY